MGRLSVVVVFGIAIGLGSCAQEPLADSIRVVRSDSAGVEIVTISGSVTDLPVWSIAGAPIHEVSGERPPFLGSVGELTFASDGGLLVEDNQAAVLHRFDDTGGHVRVIAGRGDGPGEVRAVATLFVGVEDTVWAFDRRHFRLSAFDPADRLIREVTIGMDVAGPATFALQAWVIDEDHLIVHSARRSADGPPSGPPRRHQLDALLLGLDATGSPGSGPVRFTGEYTIRGDSRDATTPLSNQPFVSVAGQTILHGSGITYELTLRRPDLQPIRVIRWNGWEEPLSATRVEALRAEFDAGLDQVRETRPETADALLEALFHPDVLPNQLPVLGRAFLDDVGRIWVSAFQVDLGRWEEQDVWHVLSAEGDPLARVRLPDRSRLAAVQDDRVAIVTRDQLDVEHVRVFALSSEPEGR